MMITLKTLILFCIPLVYCGPIDGSDDYLKAPLYRYFHAGITDHFYTTNYNELRGSKHGWKYEGIQCKLLKKQHEGSVPLYRYWSGRDHFYTTNIHEIGTATRGARGHHGYISEGVTGYCYPHHYAGTIPLHRYYHPAAINHFYTTDVNEIGTKAVGTIGRHGYHDEGVACFVFPAK